MSAPGNKTQTVNLDNELANKSSANDIGSVDMSGSGSGQTQGGNVSQTANVKNKVDNQGSLSGMGCVKFWEMTIGQLCPIRQM